MSQLLVTELRVVFEGTEYVVYLDGQGYFTAILADETAVRRETFAELQQYLADREKRRAATRSRKEARPVTIVKAHDLCGEGSGVDLIDAEIHGLAVDGSRVRFKGLPQGESVSGWEQVYRRFTPMECDEIRALYREKQVAIANYQKFLSIRSLGAAKDVAKAVDGAA